MKRTGLVPREVHVRDARLFVVAVEGRKQEPWYFKNLVQHEVSTPSRIKLLVLPPTGQGDESDPLQVLQRLDAWYRTHSEVVAPFDELWSVVDRDQHDDARMREAFHHAADRGWSFAVSDPCFEVWLLLHVKPTIDGTTPREIKRAWGEAKHQLAPGGGWPFRRSDVTHAIQRSIQSLSDRRYPPTPGTSMGPLVQGLLQ